MSRLRAYAPSTRSTPTESRLLLVTIAARPADAVSQQDDGGRENGTSIERRRRLLRRHRSASRASPDLLGSRADGGARPEGPRRDRSPRRSSSRRSARRAGDARGSAGTRGRIRLACSVGLDGFRRWVGDGDAVLRAVERSLETIFSLEVLEEVIREATELAAADSGPGAEIQRARDEMQRFAAADSLVVLTGLAVVGALYLEAVIVEGYELHPPAPPPAPHTPSPGVRPEHPIH